MEQGDGVDEYTLVLRQDENWNRLAKFLKEHADAVVIGTGLHNVGTGKGTFGGKLYEIDGLYLYSPPKIGELESAAYLSGQVTRADWTPGTF